MVPKLDTGVGGARKRWKLAKFTMAGILLTLGVTSLGTVANWQLVVSSRSIVNAAIAGAVGVVLEARFSNGPVGRDERRKDVARELQISRHAEQGIRSRARATDGRLRMAARAAHEVEARSDAVGDGLFLGEIRMPGGEHLDLIRGQAGQHTSRPSRAPPTPGAAAPKTAGRAPGAPDQRAA